MKLQWIMMSMVVAACGVNPDSDGTGTTSNSDGTTTSSNPDATNNARLPEDTGGALGVACSYTNPFSRGPECRQYTGSWTIPDAEVDCDTQQGVLAPGDCPEDAFIGNCSIPAEGLGEAVVFAYGDDASCQAQGFGCERFAGGTWTPGAVCEESTIEVPETTVFQPPELVCTEPLPGEPAGTGPGGQVCTWQLISGATEEGRRFEDYASCDVVRTQRPYYPFGRPADAEREDPRLQDETYAAELGWVKSQIQASACVCCHASSLTPEGASNWDIEQPGNFMNGFYDKGLALGANWVNSMALGAFPREQNNGFDRDISGIPSTDPERMKAFFVAELEHRGRVEADFAETAPFGGPLFDQIFYEPEPCEGEVGISPSGTLTWEGGPARYVYILEPGSLSPTIPPNLDRPEGTVWRIDVAPDAAPVASGSVRLGRIPEGATQVIPESGAPVLLSDTPYYLYVAADVGIPITRCIATR